MDSQYGSNLELKLPEFVLPVIRPLYADADLGLYQSS